MSTHPAVPTGGNDPYAGVRSAFEILAAGAPKVAETLIDIALHGKNEMARMYAAQAVLDRAGLPARVDVGVTAVTFSGGSAEQVTEDAASTIAKRLAALRQQKELTIEGNVIEFPVTVQPDDEV